eukprot:CAMPEP_0179109370 /NCGR_PEP_ID=MMETSP0796-20121207/50992_1 /TAXON_ID=73915 /ORGANISM="Pyrodinium bahamense, Strain pbaha01" /LENGTH=264 /DNA_ID=CAMNT_0020807473 /DNA_START=60 /DNA_END=854 /DNA_ORIENTATION=+
MDLGWDFCLNALLVALILFIGWFHLWRHTGKKERTPSAARSSTGPSDAGPPNQRQRPGDARPPNQRQRPAVTPVAGSAPAADAAASAIAYAASPAPPNTGEQYEGVVKRYSERNGMGFIACGALREKYGVDVRFYREEYEAASLSVGDAVAFHIALGGRPGCPKNQPWASGIARLESAGAGPTQSPGSPPPTCSDSILAKGDARASACSLRTAAVKAPASPDAAAGVQTPRSPAEKPSASALGHPGAEAAAFAPVGAVAETGTA